MDFGIRVHPAALERFRLQRGRPARAVIEDAGMSVEQFRVRLRQQSFTSEDVARLAAVLQVRPREIFTASTFHFAADELHPASGVLQ
ncbi:hypothetical protein AB0O87_02755 [Microbacterium sp. NPDC076768]|uniref:hypothetical protein n=1 Tax=Microbacterium sp. NPDC076768 TaxID=3154858 RepID=UPI00342C7F49